MGKAKDEKRVIEIDGVKLEIDLRYAREITNYKIGDLVKVLIKNYNDYTPYPGMIVGFDNFVNRPTIIIAYVHEEYSRVSIKFAYYYKGSEERIEICPMVDDYIAIEKGAVLNKINDEIEKKREEIKDLESKRDYFLKHFTKYFKDVYKEE